MVQSILRGIFPAPENRVYNLETLLLGLLGAVMIWQRSILHEFSVVGETIILVIFLGGLMGITRIPFPSRYRGRPIPLWAYPMICGVISGFMDSFLVLLMVGAARLEGPAKDQFKFKVYTMIGALIGGLITYFGEVYMLPLALKYNMREWHSMLPVVPPVIVFLLLLGWMANKLDLQVLGVKALGESSHPKKTTADTGDYFEFGVAILVLLAFQNALLCLGLLFLYSYVTGQGEDLIEVMKTETEVAVILLLIAAALIAEPISPYMSHFSGWAAFPLSVINGVLMGAIYPASGKVWEEVHILSTAVLLTPISSLVGVILFKTWGEWRDYVKEALPLALVWFVVFGVWVYVMWPMFSDPFYSVFSAPVLGNLH